MRTLAPAVILVLTAVTVALAQTQRLRDDETIAKLNLSATELKQVISGVEAAAFDFPDSWEKELRGRRLSLGAAPGLLLQGTELLCGGTGNCQIFVFRRVGKNWAPLFAGEEAPIVEGFSFGPASRQGIKDLHVVAHEAAGKAASTVYRFDGEFYRPAE